MSDGFIRFSAKMNGGSDVARLLNRYPGKVGRTLESLVKQEARGLAVELARNTRPFGFSEKARKRGEKAVAGDIVKVFALPSDAFEKTMPGDPAAADRFWANIQNRRFSKAEKTLQSSNSPWKDLSVGRLAPKIHHQSRNVRGQVTRRNPAQIVTSPKALGTYIAKIQKRVGFAKGSWINAAIMGFVFTHCAPWPEGVRASFDDQVFRESALIFCSGLTPADFQTAFKRLEEQSRELEAAQVEPVAELGGKKPRRATNPVS